MSGLERWLFAPGSARRLAALRIGLCSVLALRLTRGIYLQLAEQPRALYRPISFMQLLDSMPPRWPVLALQILGVVAAVLAAAGLRARATLPVAWACGVLLGGMTTSIGKVVHNDVLLLLAMVPLLAAPTSDAWAIDARGRGEAISSRYGWPVRTAMLVVAGAYFFSGVHKLINGGPGWVTGGNMRWVMYISSDSQAAPNPWALVIADRAWLAHVVAGAVLALEIFFPVVLYRPRAIALFVPATVAMHGGIWLAMRLDYSAQIATVLVVLIDWPAAVRRLSPRRAAPAAVT